MSDSFERPGSSQVRTYFERPYTGESEVLVGDIHPGDIVSFIHEHDTNPAESYKKDAIILNIREGWLDVVHIDEGFFHGVATTVSVVDRGLAPSPDDKGRPTWNPVNHTQAYGERITPSFHSREEAIAVQRTLDAVSELQARQGVVPAEPPIRSRALKALLEFAVNGRTASDFQQDLDRSNRTT